MNRIMRKYHRLFCLAIVVSISTIGCTKVEDHFTNSLGLAMIRIDKGSYVMGESNPTAAELADPYFTKLGGPAYFTNGDWDERPLHRVRISQPFYFSETEVTIDQFRQFRPEFQGSEQHRPYASGISWYDAVAFCEWLSKKEGKTYRLPTEAEWEYVCRAGTSTLFSSGDQPPAPETPNPWGIKNMHTNVAEWCWDWHGMYPDENQVDPVGPALGFARVVRGGGIDLQSPYYARSANRAGIAPAFPPIALEKIKETIRLNESKARQEDFNQGAKGFKSDGKTAYPEFIRKVLDNQGDHNIGLRIVQAPTPKSNPIPPETPFVRQFVKQDVSLAAYGPDPAKPYFRKRFILSTPPEDTSVEALYTNPVTGLHPGMLSHDQSPGVEVCPNGDILVIYYTGIQEITPDVATIACRLRFGSDEWDMPSFFLDFPDVDDHAPMLWNDSGTLHFFWGANRLNSGFPFQWMSSTDNGATWSETKFPVFETLVRGHSAQPINSAFRDRQGTIYVASDAEGAESVLWVSHNNGQTWIDSAGRTGGRHTTFCLLKDGRILGMGGKQSEIDGYMPKFISRDGGKTKTWEISKTPFCALGGNQRPTLIRLQSGRLFFAGDFQRSDGFQPKEIKDHGSYVALSEDEGETWQIKKLPGAQGHKYRFEIMKGATIGYSVARQAPNGVIHLITSYNRPPLHFEMNEAWILEKGAPELREDEIMKSKATTIREVKEYRLTSPNGSVRATWSAGIADDNRYLSHGTETWYYENGSKNWEAHYNLGRKTGRETYWTLDGKVLWDWDYRDNGTSVWTTYWPNGKKKTESTWKNKKCEGLATAWDSSGNITRQISFPLRVPVDLNLKATFQE